MAPLGVALQYTPVRKAIFIQVRTLRRGSPNVSPKLQKMEKYTQYGRKLQSHVQVKTSHDPLSTHAKIKLRLSKWPNLWNKWKRGGF